MESKYLKTPAADLDSVALWAFYNQAEKEAEKLKKAAAKVALAEVKKSKDKFVKTQFGGAQMINKELKKPKDSLKFLLQQKGYYELCRADAVDLTKVNELVESGALDEAEIKAHVEVNTSTYLQIKNKK